jgi:hypothetical protein
LLKYKFILKMDTFGRLPEDVLEQIKFFIFHPKYDITATTEEEGFTINFKHYNVTFRINISNPLKVYTTEYSTSFDKKSEWQNMYDAILYNEKYRIDVDENGTNLMIDCMDETIQFSCITDGCSYNMLDIVLHLKDYKIELLKVFQQLIDFY